MTVLYIIIVALVITVIALICRIQILKIEVTYARDMAKLYKESYESEQKSFKDMSDIAEKCNQEAITVLSHYNYEHYKVLTMLNGIKYAEHFLKPRKRREMWHRMRVKTYDEWKQEQDTPQEL
jgi:hypothetical protein